MSVRYIIGDKDSEKTVKEILLSDIGISVSFLRHLKFMKNGILLNGEHATVRRKVKEGDILDIATEDENLGSRLTPTEINLEIIYEDSTLVVPSKPPNMPTHPSHDHHGDTLADALAYRYRNESYPFVFRPINRLDRNTSGLTLIARDRISAAKLSASMRGGEIKKQYIAILDGILPQSEGIIETCIRRTAASIIVREVCPMGEGDYALTRYKVLAKSERHTLVLACPETGRTHQLRVHFAHLGCAILGDDIYGRKSDIISRHALHAISLCFPHPADSRELSLFAPLPEDMKNAVDRLFGADATEQLALICRSI